MNLGYLVFQARDTAAWQDFCGGMLGLPAGIANPDGSTGWTLDGAAQRLVVAPGEQDDLAAVGLDCGTSAALEERVRRLRGAGIEVRPGTEAQALARRVNRLAWCVDPAGNRVELAAGLERAAQPFASDAFPGGFHTGEEGLGHVVLVSSDLAAMEDFYVRGLGFGVTERLDAKAGPIRVRGLFLHCNRRHHTLAIFDLPSAKRIHHFMLQAGSALDVARAFGRAGQLGVPLSLDLGQHPGPDGTFSFYALTPSGFDFEIGAGSGEIEPERWDAMHTSQTSSWGHRPQWRLKLRLVRDLVLRRKPRRHGAHA